MSEKNKDSIERARAGDTAALEALLQQSEAELRRFVSQEIRSNDGAMVETDDVLQVTYFEAFLRIADFTPDGPNSLMNWLKRIARNNLIDATRKENRGKRLPPEKIVRQNDHDPYADLLSQLGGTQTSPSLAAAKAEAQTLLERAIAQLPEDYAKVVRLADLQGKSTAEMAQALNRSRGAIQMLKARAHDRLAELLGTSSRFFLDGH